MAKYSIIDMKIAAQERDGKCLSNVYIANSYFSWQCKEGHTWKAPYGRIRSGSWCPKCAGINLTAMDMQKFAKSKGGKCLSLNYKGTRKTLKWQCSKGHIWESAYFHAKHTWCHVCSQNEGFKNVLKEMQAIAHERGGVCLSKEYNPNKNLKWRCENGHVWEALGFKVRHGNWCSKCAGVSKFSIKDLHKLAKNRKGKVISTEYKNSHSKILWECSYGHRWWAKFCDVKNNKSWCPFCSGKKSVIDMQKLANKHNGQCLSENYKNVKTDLEWVCEFGHVFWRKYQTVLRGSFCPECSSSLESEKFCRVTLEDLFGQEFPKKWPPWLKRFDTGRQLQLDGYCENLKIAFEHNGLQHYKLCDRFHRSKDDLLDQKYRDRVKKLRCAEKGVYLIVIPQLGVKIKNRSINRSNLKEFILNELKKRDKDKADNQKEREKWQEIL